MNRIIWMALITFMGCAASSQLPHEGSEKGDQPSFHAKRTAQKECKSNSTKESNFLMDAPFPTDYPETLPPNRSALNSPDLSLGLRPRLVPAAKCESALFQNLLSDHSNYYSADSLAQLGGGFLVGGVMANTTIDEGIHRHFQASIRGASSDEWFEGLRANRELGNGFYTLPVLTAAWVGGRLFDGRVGAEPIGDWGERSLRTFVVGAPPMLALQLLTGGSRPGEKPSQSHWEPFQDVNGVSGHSFIGALPFINAAMLTDDPALKTLFYAGSSLAPLSRINDDAHYSSQALLGWWMAYLAARAVDTTPTGKLPWRILPFPDSSTTGIAIEYKR